MKATMETLERSRVKLTITVDAASFGEAMQKAYLAGRSRIAVPGFRKGKAPRRIIEQYYGEGVFYEDAFEICYNASYPEAVKDHGLETVEDPTLDVETIEAGQDLVYTAEVAVRPEVTLGAYKGIEAVKPAYPVSGEDVDAEVEAARERVASWMDVEDAAEMGHNVVIDYVGTVDGVAFPGGTAEKQPLELGSGRFIPGFEEGVVGMKPGEERDVPVTFPGEYHAEELAGKEAVFHVTLHQVQRKELPPLDDELAKDVSEFETLDAYRASIRERLEKQAEERADAEFENALIDAVAQNAEIDIPDALVDRQVNDSIREMSYRFAMQGMNLEQFLQYTGQTIDDLREQHRPESERRVRAGLTLDAIRKAEGIETDDESMEKEYAEYAEARGKTVEEIRSGLSESEKLYMEDRVVTQKTIAFLRDNAVITTSAPEKKPSAKKAKPTGAEAGEELASKEESPQKTAKKAKQTEVSEEPGQE